MSRLSSLKWMIWYNWHYLLCIEKSSNIYSEDVLNFLWHFSARHLQCDELEGQMGPWWDLSSFLRCRAKGLQISVNSEWMNSWVVWSHCVPVCFVNKTKLLRRNDCLSLSQFSGQQPGARWWDGWTHIHLLVVLVLVEVCFYWSCYYFWKASS